MAQRTETFEYDLRDPVEIIALGVEGFVDSILIDNLSVQYRVAFWCDSQRRLVWVFPEEIRPVTPPPSCADGLLGQR